jgi:creatinine amidohydrolase
MAATLGNRHYRRARIAALTYFTLARDAIADLRESKIGGTGHACEFETAMLMHLRPDLVKMERATTLYPDPGSRYLATDLIGASAIRTYLDFKDLSESGVLGDPSLATPEKGARFFAASVKALAAFVDDFARWPIAEGRS